MLTPKEQSKVVQILGYGGKTIQVGSVIYNKIMNDRLNQLPPDTEELVRDFISQIEAIECQMKAAPARLAATKVADIETNHHELTMLRAERRRIGREMACTLDIPFQMVGGANVSVQS
jgi:hypothetical protein